MDRTISLRLTDEDSTRLEKVQEHYEARFGMRPTITQVFRLAIEQLAEQIEKTNA